MAKKYLSLEEASSQLGITPDALKKAREKGDLRGFADRGNWKFREEDIEEYGRTISTDSDPDVPILSPDLELDFGDQSVFSGDDDIGEQPTIIRKTSDSSVLAEESDLNLFDVGDEGASDSEVRLMLDDDLMKPSDSSKIRGKQVLSDSSNVIAKSGDSSRVITDRDSSKDIPISFGDSSTDQQLEGSSVDIPISFGDSSHDMVLSLDDDDDDGDRVLGMGGSDSDVRLAVDYEDSKLSDSNSEIVLGGADSDSDVRLLDQTQPMRLNPASDSDVRLIKTDSDSDVRLVGDHSDSDVRLLPSKKGRHRPDSDSDVSLAGSDADLPLALADSGDEDLSGDGFVLGEGSDIKLGSDSGIKLETGDSGISLDLAGDSGIALDTGTDSDISLAVDENDDDGITLDTAGDSGIALDLPDDSGLSLDAASLDGTVPLLKMTGKGKKPSQDSATLVQMPAYNMDDDEGDESDTDFELGALEGDSGSSDTSVLLFDNDDDADDRGATMIKKKEVATSDETFDLGGGDEFEDEPEEELVGEDDELEDDAGEDFLADEDDFSSEDESVGDSQEGAAPAGVRYAAVEQEWGAFVFGASLVSAVLMVLAAGVMFDLVRYNWRAGDYGVVAGPLVNMLGIK